MGFKIGVAIPIGYYHGTSGMSIKARVEDESGAVFGAELTLVENAAFVAVGIDGYYEHSFTPDAAGRWAVLIYYGAHHYGQMFYDVGGGLTTQEKNDVQFEAEEALASFDLDHLIKIAHPTGDPVADSLMDLIMNFDGGQTFNRATDSLEAIRNIIVQLIEAGYASGGVGADVAGSVLETLLAIAHKDGGKTFSSATDSLEILGELIAGLVADMGVFPTANYATLAAFVEDNRTRLVALAAALVIVDGLHDIPGVDSVTNLYIRDVLGGKADTVAVVINNTNSLMRYMKGALGATWTAENLKAIYDLLDSILDMTETGATLTATGGEDTVYINNAPSGIFEPRSVNINLVNMAGGDTIQLKIYERITPAGALILMAGGPLLLYAGAQAINFSYPLNPNRYGYQITLEQTAGVNRDYPWEVFYSG